MTPLWCEAWLRERALAEGFACMELCPADGFEDARRLVQSQPSIRERRQLRFDPASDDERTRSLAVMLWPYRPAHAVAGGEVFIDSYYDASNAAYHAARELERQAAACGGFARANAPYPARAAAVRAGLGAVGQNGMLITPRYGSRVVIILLATDLPAGRPSCKAKPCMRCGRCAAACPVGAIDDCGMSRPQRCLRNYMMEGVVVPEPLREKMGMRLIGCDICQRVCPMQPRENSSEAEAVTLAGLMKADEAEFKESVKRLAGRIGSNTARPQRVRAQAALLAGNLRDPSHLDVLRLWASSPFEAVREHARWAMKRIEEAEPSADVRRPPRERESTGDETRGENLC